MEGKVAVLGSKDFVLPYTALGLDTFAVESDAQVVVEKAEELLKERYALIVVAENVAEMAQEVFEKTTRKTTPIILVIPFTTESTGFATEALGKTLKMATGINILAN